MGSRTKGSQEGGIIYSLPELRQSVAELCIVSIGMVGLQYITINMSNTIRLVVFVSALWFNGVLAFFTLWLFKAETKKVHKIYKVNGKVISHADYLRYKQS